MHIVFDMAYDQSVAPDGVRAGEASLGKLFTGPKGLLNVLETHLGLTGKATHHTMRIQGYMDCMREVRDNVLSKADAAFFTESFAADSWSSAKQMLAWRDELVLAGWTGQSDAAFTARLKALAVIDQVLPESLKQGLGDKLQRVLIALDHVAAISIEKIELVENSNNLPALLKQVMNRLAICGVEMVINQAQHTSAAGNLGRIQQAMFCASEARENIVAEDDSLILLRADDEWSAANSVASWLKAGEENNGEVLLIQGQGSDVLDAALHNAGLPMLGNNQRSAWRAALQILPLSLANVWNPLDIHALLSLLSLPYSPVPSFAAQLLCRAIQNEPGIGGEHWLKAEQKITKEQQQILLENGLDEDAALKQAPQLMEQLKHHLTNLRFDPSEGIPPESLKAMCEWVKLGLKSPSLERSMTQALAQVECMIALADCYQKPIPRAQVERMLDSVIAEGGENSEIVVQAAPWLSVFDSGAIAAEVETIIWWGFTDPGQSSMTFWSGEERSNLASIGIHLETSQQVRARQSQQWRNALAYAGKRLILVTPKRLNGQAVQPHPLWDEIRHFATQQQTSDSEKKALFAYLTVEGQKLHQQESISFAGREMLLEQEKTSILAQAQATIAVEPGCIVKPKRLSFSQMSTLIGCPTKWALQYHAGLRAMDSLSLPTGNTMIGSLCHKIVEDLYLAPTTWSADTVTTRASELFDIRVPQMAAELLESGREVERQRYRLGVCDAVDALVKSIDQAALHVTKTEGKVEGKALNGIPFRGYIDLLLEDHAGNTFVIDLKWSSSIKYKKEEVEKGKALQLASYAWMLAKSDSDWAPGAYFMLAQGEVLTDDVRFNTTSVIESPLSAKEVWNSGSKTWTDLFKKMTTGEIEVSGLIEGKELQAAREEADLMYSSPPCHFCDFGKLCGKARAEA
ncbi:MAG: PD-(D/E)XK nuclease family protein [Mariprofundaceae bacterium]|nr:PD-(D/E)XK nuclease family protein [Mariprofundaceae bacterium]